MSKFIISSFLSFTIGFLVARNLYFNSSHTETSLKPLNISEVVKIKEVDSVSESTNETGKKTEVSEVVPGDQENFPKKAKKKFKDDRGLKLETLLSERFEKGEVQSEVNSPGGGKYTKEKLSDGRIVNREYNQDKILIGESGKNEYGELSKSFFENGQTKGMKVEFADGTIVSILNDLSGTITTRKDELPSGDEIAWDFNDYGEVTRRWLIRKNQKPVLLD
jgi:hypothetical protein